jgi:hypothetical protein
MASFSLVASAWKSTNTGTSPASFRILSATRNGLSGPKSMAQRPIRFTTATGPSFVSKSPQPRPGRLGSRFAGRRISRLSSRKGTISRRLKVWLPSVSTSAPAASIASACAGVRPHAVGVFAVHDAEIRAVQLFEPAQMALQAGDPGRADDVADGQKTKFHDSSRFHLIFNKL